MNCFRLGLCKDMEDKRGYPEKSKERRDDLVNWKRMFSEKERGRVNWPARRVEDWVERAFEDGWKIGAKRGWIASEQAMERKGTVEEKMALLTLEGRGPVKIF